MKYSSSLIVRTDNVQRYFKDINNPKFNPLDDVVIRRLFADRNRNRERIVNANIRLVATIAKSYDKADNFMDFNQEGIEGLIEAVDKYDPNADAKFSSYAANWIRARMSMLCRELNMVQRSNQGKIGSKANKFKEQFFNENMRDATTEEIIEHLSENCGIDVLYANEVYGISINSINEELNDDELTPETCGEFAVKTSCQNAYVDQIEQEDLADAINKMMTILTDKERDFIIRHIYNEETYETIAETTGYTNERVRQIVMGGLKKMKNCEFAKRKFACFLK
jgi:RNA polymerase sigma factor (sigma-70 family)